ncbi:sensor histidine kinase TmoS [Clostridium homopropionicum DSM 5847]|uniref:histidine kinase n=1 Tax=Clostridium homopropionicum DSM 5847 TaxID=1121318 RepID=A0A0L6Z8I3_9CLOT|nr:AAA family ATPase [Clostridium homopropionicum]KOA19277.1 sensor histidine kinase TmoS [Clostridium homopropionicum DSM 5847]SFG19514.1 Predicted ATPase [Clostridium homopropionicum]
MYNSQCSTVFKALDVKKNQNVIIKSLNTEFDNLINTSKIESIYNLVKKLESEYVLKAYELLEFQNRLSVTLEDIGGIYLSQYIKKNPIELKELLEIALKITKCIKYIHNNHIIHKNINPFNIIYNKDKKIIKLLGFENSSEFSFETAEALNPNIFHDNLFYISPEQTGRMNRPVDYRTDFYSLGITLYELACSKLPFASFEPEDVVYFHIAKTPLPISEINPSIPPSVSKIISKLMEKMPEDRYVSALGIELDLQECINQLEEKGIIEEFELGKNDLSYKFEIPKKIYGREAEIKKLLNIFERAAKGNVELILIGGYSGIGKTALVNELHKPIIKNHGIFLSGKCDQYNKNTPYSALFNALDQFCTYILSDSEAAVKKWRERILDSLGKNAALLIDVIPKLELILGSQPKLKEGFLVEIQIKFSAALQKLLRVISSKRRPIALVIDDVQWIDAASLELFQKILSDNSIKGLMFVCTYRENEVDKFHPLIRTIEKIQKDNGKIEYLYLDNLNIFDITEMIFNIFNFNEEDTYGLANIVYEKTIGNPFYIIEFLKYCNKEKLLYYNEYEKRWSWNESDIRNIKSSDNVVNLLIEKIKTLPEATKELIFMAACIGNRFDIKILSAISGKSLKNVSKDLEPAIANEMIYVLGKDGLNSEKVEFLFCHDRFQQAGYFALSEENKKIIHMSIANYYETIEGLNNTSTLFLAAEHYSKILDCIKREEDVNRVINIFFNAAQAARCTSAFDTARQYLELIFDIAPDTIKNNQSFIQTIYNEYHLVLFSLADFEEVDKIYSIIEKITENPLKLVNAACVQLVSLSNRSRYEEAFILGISILEKLGVSYPKDKLSDVVEKEIEKFYLYQYNGSIEKIKEKELLYGEKDNAIAKLLNRIIAAGLFFNPLSCFWAILVSANLMVEKGVTNWALEISSAITLALVPLRNDYYTGYKFSKEAISTLKKRGFNEELYRMYHVHSLVNCHWFEPLETGIYYAHKSYKGNLENGEFEFSCFSFFTSQVDILECCNSISEMQTEVEAAITFASKTGNLYSLESFVSFMQFVKALKGETICYGSFNDNTFNEEKHLNDINKNGVALAYYYIYRALSAVLFSDFKVAYILIKKAVPHLSHVGPFYIVALQRFIMAISICKVIEEVENLEEKQMMEKTLEEAQEWMYQRAKDAPFNFKHLYDIVCAEIKALEGKYDEAFKLYEKAIVEAEKNKRPYHYALICEIIGQKYLRLGINKTASFYIKEAYSRFLDWGAVGKAKWMKEKYTDILFFNTNSQYLSVGCNTLNCIDLKAIIKVSQTISREIERKKLLEKLMKIVMQNSGSTMGHILLKDKNSLVLLVSGRLNFSFEVIIEHRELNFDNKKTKAILPASIVNYVATTKEEVIIDNISRSQFAYDSYFESNSIKSVLCMPILQQNTLKGVLYLENDILSGAYTKNNIEVFKIIASQAAISIENAFLYNKLENKVKERTFQLEETIEKLKETNTALEKEIINRIATEKALKESERQISYTKEYDKIKMEFLANISHELRTPINVIFSALQMHEYKLKHCSYENAHKDCFKYGNTMKQNCYRLLRLINNLIDITKIDTGYFDLNEINIDIISLIEDITLSVADYVENKGLSLIFDTDVEEKVIACDPEKIERIILNLLSNAAKFTPKGGNIMVIIEDGVESIFIRVKDNGRGIPKEKLNSIFERFVQVDKSFTRDHEGSGIGLSLVKALVELHGGTISVNSTEGCGTEFIISIPCKLLNETHNEISCCEELTKSCIEKINIEFSDIYK